MASSSLTIGVSGLSAAQAGLATTGHNIANVSTPGFTRQRTTQAMALAQFTGGGYFGRGTQVSTVQRIYNEFLIAQTRDAESQANTSGTSLQELSRMAGILGDETGGLTPALSDFFGSIQEIASHPGDVGARSNAIANANALTQRARDLDSQLQRLRSDADKSIQSTVEEINGFTQQIADLNQKIALAEPTGQPPNDLLDQRDAMLRDLSKSVRVTVSKQSDGTVSVFTGTGQALVVGNTRYKMVADPDPAYLNDVRVGLQTGASTVYIQARDLGGGSLASYFSLRDGRVTTAQNELGRITQVVTTQVNQQHRLGQDKNGALGGDVFSVAGAASYADGRNTGGGTANASIVDATLLEASDYRLRWDGSNYQITRLSDNTVQTFASLPQVLDGVSFSIVGAPAVGDSFLVQPTREAARSFSVVISDPNKIAAAAPVRANATISNLGNGTISSPVVQGPTPDANLMQPVTITFTSLTTFDVNGIGTGNLSGLAYTPGASIGYNGWQLKINNAPQAGDSFTIVPNTAGSGDNHNALALADLQRANVVDGVTLAAAYGSLVSGVGASAHEAEVTNKAHENLLQSADASLQSVSGVNLDEEAANLLRYQQAYQASAKYISITGALFDDLLSAVRG